MLSNHTHERLAALGLAGMAKAFDDQQRQPDVTALTFEQRLGHLAGDDGRSALVSIVDDSIADAVLDRLVHNAHRLTLNGDSMRKITAQRANLDAAKKT